jgi:hypothetical protein
MALAVPPTNDDGSLRYYTASELALILSNIIFEQIDAFAKYLAMKFIFLSIIHCWKNMPNIFFNFSPFLFTKWY